MAKFEKIPKEQWLKMSKEEQDYYTLRFNESVERRRWITLISTRAIALLLVIGLIWVGFIQYKLARDFYNEESALVKEKGTDAYCYLCGKYSFKTTSCYYPSQQERQQLRDKTFNYTAKGIEIAEDNVIACNSSWGVDLGGLEIPQLDKDTINLSSIN